MRKKKEKKKSFGSQWENAKDILKRHVLTVEELGLNIGLAVKTYARNVIGAYKTRHISLISFSICN